MLRAKPTTTCKAGIDTNHSTMKTVLLVSRTQHYVGIAGYRFGMAMQTLSCINFKIS